MKIGDTIEAKVTATDSFYKQVKGVITEINNSTNIVSIDATKVVSKWSKDDEWKDHPTSCSMSVNIDNIIIKSTTNVLQDAYISAYSFLLLNKANGTQKQIKDSSDLWLIAKKNLIQGFIDWSATKSDNLKLKGATAEKFFNFGTSEMIDKIFKLAYNTIFTPVN